MRRRIACLLALTLLCPSAPARDISTAFITQATIQAAPACLRWQPVGVCVWLRCTLSGCSIRESVKVGHYNPDLVVSAYHRLGENPWIEARALLQPIQTTAANAIVGALSGLSPGTGDRTEGTAGRDHRNLIYKEADAIGHPFGLFASALSGSGLMCRSMTNALTPYFMSATDALAWRFTIPEILYPQSWIPGLREIGQWPLNTWGGVYPRHGFVLQAEDPKAAAVAMQRAGDIVTRQGQPHVYQAIRSGRVQRGGQMIWAPGALRERNAKTGTWQLLSPVSSNSCEVFGSNDVIGASSWADGKVDDRGDYAAVLWRPYKCCRKRGQLFLGSIDIIPYP